MNTSTFTMPGSLKAAPPNNFEKKRTNMTKEIKITDPRGVDNLLRGEIGTFPDNKADMLVATGRAVYNELKKEVKA